MAHDPALKAIAFGLFDLTKGISEVATILKGDGITKSCVQKWHKEWQTQTGQDTAELKLSRFTESVERFAISVMDMLTAQADLLANPVYLKDAKTPDVIAHTRFILDGFLRIQAKAAPAQDSPALPEVIEGIPVEEPD